MELVDITLTEFTRRTRSVVVAHNDTDLTRGLEYGETILVRVDGTDYRAAVVVDIEFSASDTQYRLIVGGRVPAEMVADRLAENPRQRVRAHVTVNDVVDYLGQAAAGQRIPAQRRPADH